MVPTLPRLLLVLALAIGIPLQGFAAAAETLCGDHQPHGAALGHPDHGSHGNTHHDCPPCASAAIAGSAPLFLPGPARFSSPAAAAPRLARVTSGRLDRPPLAR